MCTHSCYLYTCDVIVIVFVIVLTINLNWMKLVIICIISHNILLFHHLKKLFFHLFVPSKWFTKIFIYDVTVFFEWNVVEKICSLFVVQDWQNGNYYAIWIKFIDSFTIEKLFDLKARINWKLCTATTSISILNFMQH